MIQYRHLANAITLTRILGVLVIFWLTPFLTNLQQMIVIMVYAAVCLTDILDGWVARRFGMVTEMGKVLDPLADKILVLVFLPLMEMKVIGSFPVFVILAREFAVMALRVMSAKEGEIIPASASGKIKTIITLPICGILFGRVPIQERLALPFFLKPLDWLARWVFSWPNWVLNGLIWLMVAVTLWSFFDYLKAYIWKKFLKKFNGDEQKAKRALRSFIPNAFTMLNLFCGIGAVLISWFGSYTTAVCLVLFGIMFDAIDGTLARKLDAKSVLGAKLDSRADSLSFGWAPTIVIFKLVKDFLIPHAKIWAVAFALIYWASVMYRLNRFNASGHSDIFQGLPSPVGAALVLLAAISGYLSSTYVFLAIVLIVSLLMVSKIPYVHLNVASRHQFLRYLNIPILIFFVLTILNLMDIQFPRQIFTYEILFVLTTSYVVSPLFVRLSNLDG